MDIISKTTGTVKSHRKNINREAAYRAYQLHLRETGEEARDEFDEACDRRILADRELMDDAWDRVFAGLLGAVITEAAEQAAWGAEL